MELLTVFLGQESLYFLLVLHLAQQNVDQQQWLLALVVRLAAFLHGVAKWFLHSPNRETFIKQIEAFHSFAKIQLATSPLVAFLWILSVWFIFKRSPGLPLQKDRKSKENYLRPMDNAASLHIWSYYCSYESAERTYLQPSSIRSTDIKIWSWSHWYF